MRSLIKVRARPKLNSPVMLAAWPGVGNVSTIVVSYLRDKLNFKLLGWIEPTYFFDPIGVLVKDNVVESPQFPQSVFYYWKNRHGQSDVVLFIGDDQPVAKGYELAHCVLNLAQALGVKRVYTFAAALTRIHHTEQPKVWGAASNPRLVAELKRRNLVESRNLKISGLNGLLLGVSKERDIDAVCLLGEVPSYARNVENPMAALAVLKVLTAMLGVDLDLTDITQVAEEARERIKEAAAVAMGEYIDYFTEPIWERGGEDEEAEEEEEE